MMPLEIFRSRQFSAANVVTFVVYAALGGFFFLFVAFLQISLGYSPIAAGAASLPVTGADAPAVGALGRPRTAHRPPDPAHRRAARDRARAAADDPDRARRQLRHGVLPAVIVFGLGLTLVVAPVTATVLAAADARHSGIASGINNAVSRVGGPARGRRPPAGRRAHRRRLLRPRGDDRRLPHRRCSSAPCSPRSAASSRG